MTYTNTRDTADRIFNDRYLVKVRAYQIHSLDSVRQYGVRTSGDADMDKAASQDIIVVGWSINHMVEAFKLGKSFSLVEPKDAEKIYLAITAHLNRWAEIVTHSFNHITPPQEDLDLLDELAHKLYPMATRNKPQKSMHIGFGKFNAGEIKNPEQEKQTNTGALPPLVGYSSMANFFRQSREQANQRFNSGRQVATYSANRDEEEAAPSYRSYQRRNQ